jgi:predicted permease
MGKTRSFVMREFIRRLWYVVRKRRLEDEVAEEMAFHRAMTRDELAARGVDPADADAATQRTLGNTLLARDQARDVWIAPWLQGVAPDLRFAARLLRKERRVTLVIVVSLALALGGNATIFTIINGMTLRGLPVDRPDRIVGITTHDAAGARLGVSYADFLDWRAAAPTTFAGLAAHRGMTANITEAGLSPPQAPRQSPQQTPQQAPQQATGAYISANAFRLLGERPILGREFTASEDQPGAAQVVILGDRIWEKRYQRDPTIVGRTIAINGVRATIVGVMRDGFRFPMVHDLWQPLGAAPGLDRQPRSARGLTVFGRMTDRATRAQAQSELQAIAARLSRAHPDTNANITPRVTALPGGFNATDVWSIMLYAVGLLLLVACANVAGLLLARSTDCAREIAIRASLGASRLRIVRQLMIESFAMAAMAGLLGWGVGALGVRVWVASLPEANWPYWFVWTMDARVFGFLAAISLGTAGIFGLAPAWHLSRADANEIMKDGGRSGMRTRHARRWTSGLLVFELALTLVLLASAGLMLRSLLAVYRADRIVDTAGIMMASLSLPEQKYATREQQTAFVQQLDARLRGLPAVATATFADAMPFYTSPTAPMTIDGRASTNGSAPPTVSRVTIGARYFETLGLVLLRGRLFDERDGAPGHEAAIVSQQFANLYFPNEDPIGRRIRLSNDNAPWVTIVGVSPTVRQHYAQEIDPVVYIPYRQNPGAYVVLLARAPEGVDAAAVTPPLREAIGALDGDLPTFDMMSLASLLAGSQFANRAFATVFGAFAVLALVLSAMGLYAVTAYAVTQRTQEIGVRVALGAQGAQVVWLFVRRALQPIGAGLVLGMAGAVAAGRLMRGMLIQTSASDPITLASIAILLIGVALAACVWPARRATRLDPVKALRFD